MRILDGAFLDALETLDINVQQMKSGHYSGARRSRAYGSSPEFADYREYVPGDDLRRIDWNAAARFDKYLIKRFIDEKQGRNCVYLDTSASMGFEPEKGFAALRMAAALGYLSVCNMDSVSFRLLSGTRCTELCTRISGRESFLRAGEKLDALQFAGDVPVEEIEDLAENSAVCVPTMMPYITAFFMPRTKGDRPDVIPDGCVNFAFLGQFADTPRDTVFTTEYSVRTAMEAVYGLLGVDRGVPEVWGSVYDVRELLDSSVKLMDGKSPLEIQLPGPLNALKKPLLKLVKGNVIEKLLRDHDILKDNM